MAVIHTFPHRPRGADHAMFVGKFIRESFPPPTERNDELIVICAMAELALMRHAGQPCVTMSQMLGELRA